MAKAPSLPDYLKEMFFEAIRSFPEVNFIWKWDGQPPKDIPDNLMTISWIDQQDLLGTNL